MVVWSAVKEPVVGGNWVNQSWWTMILIPTMSRGVAPPATTFRLDGGERTVEGQSAQSLGSLPGPALNEYVLVFEAIWSPPASAL